MVLLSARAGQEATVEGLAAGADDYLVKPFSARELVARLAANLERAGSRRQLREGEARFRALVGATADATFEMNPDWTEVRAAEGRGVLAEPVRAAVGWAEAYLPPEDRPQMMAAIGEAIATKSPFHLEHRARRADGSMGWMSSRAVPLLDERGEITGWFGAATDITERMHMQEHLRLVVHELNHRVKNNLAMTQAMAAQTFRDQNDGGAAQTAFTARLVALARANDLLTGERWVGASLRRVLEQALEPYCGEHQERCVIDGPAVTLSSKTALSVALATHELATNAVKHGAWSSPEGKVSVTWKVDGTDGGERLRLQWRESGGPSVAAPARRGFGSRLVERGLSAEMGGEVKLDFRPEGLVCTIDAPLAHGEAE